MKVIVSSNLAGTLLVVGGSLSVSELYPLVRLTGWKVFNLPEETGLNYRTEEALKIDLGDPEVKIISNLQVGEEWFVILDKFPKQDAELTNLFVRSRNQSRVSVFSIEALKQISNVDELAAHILSFATPDTRDRLESQLLNLIRECLK